MIGILTSLVVMSAPAIDVRVDGEGYLRFAHEGKLVFSKSAKLCVINGKLCHENGAIVIPTIPGPADAQIKVDLEGYVTFGAAKPAGRLVLAIFKPSAKMREQGDLLSATEAPKLANPGEGLNGVIRSGPASVSDAKHTPGTRATGPITIIVTQESQVDGDRILLGEVAKIEGDAATAARLADVFLGETPILGLRRLLTKQSITTRLLAAKEKTEDLTIIVPDDSYVSRRGQLVAAEQMAEAAKAHVQSQLGAEIQLVDKEPVKEVLAPIGELSIVPISVSDTLPTLSVVVAIRVDGKQIATRTVKLQADAAAQGVKRGDDVKIRIRSNTAVVELSGKAKDNALIGQTVQVVTSRNTTHTGKVIAPGLVEVSL